jgi:hypothetical protein
MKEGLKKMKQKLKDTKEKLVTELQSSTTAIIKPATKMEKAVGKALGDIKAEKERTIKNLNDKSRTIREESLKLTETAIEEIKSIKQEAIETMDITLATILNESNRAVETAIKGPSFVTTVQEQIDEYIQSYPQEIHDSMIKFTEEFFKDNESVEYYIRMVATPVIDIGNIQQQIEEHQSGKGMDAKYHQIGRTKYHNRQYPQYYRY